MFGLFSTSYSIYSRMVGCIDIYTHISKLDLETMLGLVYKHTASLAQQELTVSTEQGRSLEVLPRSSIVSGG